MSQIRLLSIDFDGVLHGSTEILGLELPLLAQMGASHLKQLGLFRLAELLRKVLEEVNADDVVIVVHSSWRREKWALPLIRQLIAPLQKWYQGTTDPDIISREASIHACCERFGIEDFLIIDDAPHEFVLPSSKSRLVVTDPTKGLDDEQVLARVRQWALGGRGV